MREDGVESGKFPHLIEVPDSVRWYDFFLLNGTNDIAMWPWNI